jgi:ribose transport system substrate-binding protein
MKISLRVLLLFGLAALLPGCRAAPPGGADKVLLVLKTSDNPFFRSIEQGMRNGLDLKRFELHVRYGTTDGDASTQRQVLEAFLEKHGSGPNPSLKAVALAPSGSGDELTQQIKKLRDAGIRVILVDSQINEDALRRAGADYDSYIGSSNREGGGLAGKIMRECLPQGGRVLVFNGIGGVIPSIERRAGFLDALQQTAAQKGVQYEITEKIANYHRLEAQSALDGLYALGRKFDGIFAANDQMALGALEAIRQAADPGHPIVIGFDAVPEAVAAVRAGKLCASVAQDPYRMGRLAAETVHALVAGAKVEKNQFTPLKEVRGERPCPAAL